MPTPYSRHVVLCNALRWSRRGRWVTVWAFMAVLAASTVLAQDDQNEKRGFDAESLYSVGEIDTVNLFNGGLSMVIPIGNRYPLSTGTSCGRRRSKFAA